MHVLFAPFRRLSALGVNADEVNRLTDNLDFSAPPFDTNRESGVYVPDIYSSPAPNPPVPVGVSRSAGGSPINTGPRQRRTGVSKPLVFPPPGSRQSSQVPSPVALPHENESNWYLPNASRDEAQRLLHDKPDGSFLIRNSSQKGILALSVV